MKSLNLGLVLDILLLFCSHNVRGFQAECPLLSLQYLESSIHSQNGEDGVIAALLSILGITDRTYVEFGVDNGTQCNTRQLREKFGFSGLLMDGSHFNESINLKKEYITVDNIIDLFEKYHVPDRFGVLSVDLDMYDWWVLEMILNKGAFRPQMIVVEVNPTLGHYTNTDRKKFNELNSLPLVVSHPHHTSQTHWDHSRYFGANPTAFQLLGKMYGYDLLYCESCGVNCFLAQQSLLPSSCNDPPPPRIPRPCYFHSLPDNSTAKGHAPDTQARRPILLTKDLLEMDMHALTSQSFDMYLFGAGEADDRAVASTGMVLFFFLHFSLLASFIYYCYHR